jgi:hypothetical protein
MQDTVAILRSKRSKVARSCVEMVQKLDDWSSRLTFFLLFDFVVRPRFVGVLGLLRLLLLLRCGS